MFVTENNNLTASLLAETSSRIKIRAEGGSIIFYVDKTVDTGRAVLFSLKANILYFSALTFVMVTKCVASSGMMVFSEKDLLENQDYIFWKSLFRYLPKEVAMIIIVCTVFSDTFMNLVTRGAATAKMLKPLFYSGVSDGSHAHLLSGPPALKAAKVGIIFCGALSSVTASLVAFLGAVTLGHYITDDLRLLLPWGGLVAIANFIVNISYRVDRSVENFVKCLNRELTYSYWNVAVSTIGSTAFLGTCYYGTANAIRKLLALLHVYAGNPDSGIGRIVRYENWINGATDATLPFALIAYFFSSCVPMFSQTANIDPRPKITVPLNHVVLFANSVQDTDYYQSLKFYQRDYWYPKLLKLFCVTMMPFFVVSALLGNALATFNSSNGLIIHILFGKNAAFGSATKMGIGLLSALLTFVFSKIFWSFNVIDWFSKVEECWLREELRVMQQAGIYDPLTELTYVQQDIDEVVEDSNSVLVQQGMLASCFSCLWSPYRQGEIMYKKVTNPLTVTP